MKTWQKWFVLGIFLLVVSVSCLTGCSETVSAESNIYRFQKVEDLNNMFTIYYDTQTGVEYAVNDDVFEPLIDSDGKPLLHEGYER